jgi:NAD(P)-dependent dehydrogenase (short-subunit alcohol dehydrogenase family)
MPDLLQFTDQFVLITGGATGIGRAVALAFARQGATVVVGGRPGRGDH